MTAATNEWNSRIETGPPRILVAVHGGEPGGWADEAGRLVATWNAAALRVVAVLAVPAPPLTSFTPLARRAYAGARAQWTAIERQRLEATVDALCRVLPQPTHLSWVSARRGDVARAIADTARQWPADVVVVAAADGRSWLAPASVHARLVRLAACTVLVVAPPRPAPAPRRRLAFLPRPAAAGQGG